MLGLLEGAFHDHDGDASPLPTVTAVVRSLTGRHVWSMQLRNNPRSQQVKPALNQYTHVINQEYHTDVGIR